MTVEEVLVVLLNREVESFRSLLTEDAIPIPRPEFVANVLSFAAGLVLFEEE